MTETARRRLTIDEFFAWQEKQSDRYELVDGFPPANDGRCEEHAR
jgi:hypothetical protein